MTLDTGAIEQRLPLWKALSDLFLDTALEDADFKHIATQVLDSSFPPDAVQEILWEEVFPALADNLRIGTGEWSAFEDDWLKSRIVNVLNGAEQGVGSYGLISEVQVRRIVADAWNKVSDHLPDTFRHADSGELRR